MKKKIIMNQLERVIFGVIIILIMKGTVIEIKVEEYLNKIRLY